MGIDDLTNDQQKVLTALNVAFSSVSIRGVNRARVYQLLVCWYVGMPVFCL